MKKLNKILPISIVLIIFACSNNKKNDEGTLTSQPENNSVNQRKLNIQPSENKDYDPCDCNKRAQKIIDETITYRLKFESISDLKKSKESKDQIKIFAKDYIRLMQKCFETNAAMLTVDSECNNLILLQAKKDSLRKLGIQLEQGEAIRL